MIQDFKLAAFTVFAMSILASAATSIAGSQKPLPSDDETRKILVERIGANENDTGIIVGVIEPQGRRIISFGHRNAGDPRPLDGDTVFEIGSVTKVFTAFLLADMVGKKEIALADPVAKYLPPTSKSHSATAVRLHFWILPPTHRVCHSCRRMRHRSMIQRPQNIPRPISNNTSPAIS